MLSQAAGQNQDRLTREVGRERADQPGGHRSHAEHQRFGRGDRAAPGSTDSEARIIPMEYSEVMVSAPNTAMMSWPRTSPNRLRSVACAMSAACADVRFAYRR
jgi:hypothetical protein